MSELVNQFQNLSAWRDALATAIERLRLWLANAKLLDSDTAQRLDLARERISTDRLILAFVAEFSRGKSELINAMFFADFGGRVLPAAAGRTTMCPTEILYDETLPPSIRLLPIETRARTNAHHELTRSALEWQVFPLDTSSLDGMLEAFGRVAQTVRVGANEAQQYGLYDPANQDHAQLLDAHGMLEISRWRHAIINFPHPLLRDGLVVIDTPGLNALGTEPELTLSLIPSAHAIVFMLSADTGVTRSDLQSWQQIAQNSPQSHTQHVVALNKIDTLWDGLRSHEAIDAEIHRQLQGVANTLQLDASLIYPVSAQKGLVAKIQHDDALLARSGLPQLENGLSRMVMPSQRNQLRQQALDNVERILNDIRHGLATREHRLVEQLYELRSLQGKNMGAVQRVALRAQAEHREFDDAIQRIFAARAVLLRQSAKAKHGISMDSLRLIVQQTKDRLSKVKLSPQFTRISADYFSQLREQLRLCADHLLEMEQLVTGLQRQFSSQMGWTLPAPMHFNMAHYLKLVDTLEQQHGQHFATWDLLTRHQWALVERFFEAVIDQSRQIFQNARRDVDAWARSLLPPLERQAREHRHQLRKRADAADRIQHAQISLDERIGQLEESTKDVQLLLEDLRLHAARIHAPYADPAQFGNKDVNANTTRSTLTQN